MGSKSEAGNPAWLYLGGLWSPGQKLHKIEASLGLVKRCIPSPAKEGVKLTATCVLPEFRLLPHFALAWPALVWLALACLISWNV